MPKLKMMAKIVLENGDLFVVVDDDEFAHQGFSDAEIYPITRSGDWEKTGGGTYRRKIMNTGKYSNVTEGYCDVTVKNGIPIKIDMFDQ